MRAGTLKLAALIGLGALSLLGPAPADPSDDLAGTPGGMAAGGGSSSDPDDVSKLDIVDDALKPKLEVMRIGSQRGGNNLLNVFLGLSNKTARRIELQVETIYRDKGGNELNTSSWMRITLGANGQQDYRSQAISEAAVDFMIRVRRALPR